PETDADRSGLRSCPAPPIRRVRRALPPSRLLLPSACHPHPPEKSHHEGSSDPFRHGLKHRGATLGAHPRWLSSGALLELSPLVDAFDIEAPIGTDLEGGNAPSSEKAVDGTGMNLQVVGHILDGEDFPRRRRIV